MINNNQKKNKDIEYTHSERKKISQKIKKLKKKEDYVKLFKIVNSDKNNKFTENSNGIWLDFKILSDETVRKVDNFLKKTLQKKDDNESANSLEYVPYSKDDLIFNKNTIGPKLSNYEKSIIKKNNYLIEQKTFKNETNVNNWFYKQ